MTTQTFQIDNFKITVSIEKIECENEGLTLTNNDQKIKKERKIQRKHKSKVDNKNKLPWNWEQLNPAKEIFKILKGRSLPLFKSDAETETCSLTFKDNNYYITTNDGKFTNVKMDISIYSNENILRLFSNNMYITLCPCWVVYKDVDNDLGVYCLKASFETWRTFNLFGHKKESIFFPVDLEDLLECCNYDIATFMKRKKETIECRY